ncbi:Aminoacyl tRNA synthetase complex-interacting multifunctional protein 1 [Fasciola gigantica]|uniref:Aminoacyl tRNA synthetase complex-interacting multifunctional protein 1 n=1 Tax=Fasciola gigantica TaxID=46835 RepID=A0A504YEP2_FASGI|nr:Aminoacyl tRNA synthetase complex-interacting multifunctional protein 1 [Fasciola gigantica]
MRSSTLELLPRLGTLQSKIKTLRSLVTPEAIEFVENQLRRENTALELEIESIRRKIVTQELRLGVLQYKVPVRKAPEPVCGITEESAASKLYEARESAARATTQAVKTKQSAPETGKVKPRCEDKLAAKRSASGGGQRGTDVEGPVDVGRLDMRVGRIVEVERHPNADSLYVEKVDLGEGRLRTVVSGLVKFVPMEALQNKIGIFLCNLKPAKMRDVESEAMLMCASAPESGVVEPLIILDSDSVSLGDSVVVPGYTHNPDDQLKPKKKIFEQVKPDLRVDQDGFATYKGVPWTLKSASTASIKAEKLRDVQIA